MGHKVGKSREQLKMLFCLEEMVAKDSPARQIDEFVDSSDTSYFAKSEVKNTGCPPYNREEMRYDPIGNPLIYRNTRLEWGYVGKLIRYGDIAKYTYLSDGSRRTKTINGKTTKFQSANGKLLSQNDGAVKISYLYGADGICGFSYDGQEYIYMTNIQGDITHILDMSGTVVARYIYDAWGNHKAYMCYGASQELVYDSATRKEIDITELMSNGAFGQTIPMLFGGAAIETNAETIRNSIVALINPIRYRGYYYDSETGLFYTPGRYYDPEVGRWINADDVAYLDPETIGGLNLYSYCGNDPINRVDPTGNSWESFWGGVGNWFKDNWVKLAVGAAFIIVGAAVTFFTAGMGTAGLLAAGGALLASAKAVGISMAISAGIGFALGGFATGTWEGALQGFGNGLADGFMWGGIFAGGAQILSGGFKVATNLGHGGFKSGLKVSKHVKFLSPNKAGHFEAGGSIVKIGNLVSRAGRNIRLDVGVKSLLHINVQIATNHHFFIGQYLAGIIGGFS